MVRTSGPESDNCPLNFAPVAKSLRPISAEEFPRTPVFGLGQDLFKTCLQCDVRIGLLELIVMFFSTESFRMLVPAVLYSLQNSLQYVAASNLDISVCQVLYQMKLVTTALFSVAMLNRQLTPPQWWGIFLCALGVAAVQLSTAENSQQKAGQQAWVGFLAVSVACITSGLAAVYTEKVFKSGNSSLWVRNMHLAGWSLVAISWGLVANDGSKIREKGFFLGWNFLVCVVVALQALGGMAVAVVAKYADNISKGFATAISIILTCVASVYLFDLHPSATFTAGTSLVLLSLYLYTRPVKNGQTIKYMEISQKDLEDHHDLPDKVQQSAFRIGVELEPPCARRGHLTRRHRPQQQMQGTAMLPIGPCSRALLHHPERTVRTAAALRAKRIGPSTRFCEGRILRNMQGPGGAGAGTAIQNA
ncbi:SLC35A1 [Symbiodinium microadriaticum]|nr:SLC35A1 [Symbiodinium sp. KB8]CAE7491110.1 SLC35A1 [Symbiodinium microadriaticum]